MSAFTLVELLVSMTVLVLIIGLLAQLVDHTSLSIMRSTKGMDNVQLSTLALDRIGSSFAGMITSGAGTLVAYKNTGGSDGLAMITNSRVRSRAGGTGTNINVDSFTDIRMGARGFCVINTADPSPSIPMLSWGDGTIVWSKTNNAASVQGDPTQALLQATKDVMYQTSGSGQAGNMLNFSPLSRGIFRFELAFLLSDGTTVSGSGANLPILPDLTSAAAAPLPRNKYFVAGEVFATPPATFPAAAYPLAFSAANSDAAPRNGSNGQNVYVRAVIVGIASLDAATQKILSSSQLTQLAATQTFPKITDGKTPAQAWNVSDQNGPTYPKLAPPSFPLPVLQNIRITQRYYYVN